MSDINSLEISVHNDFVGEPDAPIVEDDELEEGEASEDEVEINLIINKPKICSAFGNNQSRYGVSKDFDDGIESISDNTIDDKLDERAHRFGEISKPGYLPKDKLQTLYKSLNLCEDDFNRGGWRFDALCVKGIVKKTKQDIYNYFSDFEPKYLEWLSDDECNVVFDKSAAAALCLLSCPIEEKVKPQTSIQIKINNPNRSQPEEKKISKVKEKTESSDSSSNSSDSDDDSSSDSDSSSNSDSSSSSSSSSSESESSSSDEEMEEGETYGPEEPPKEESNTKTIENTAAVSDIAVDVPTDGRWRLGVPFPGAKAVFMRFAHCKDRRVLGLKNSIEIFDTTIKGKSEKSKWHQDRIPRDQSKVFSRLGRMEKSNRIPWQEQPRSLPPQNPFSTEPKNYKDLDDPVSSRNNPWGFIAENWTSKDTQQSIDYQALLRDHILGENTNTRKRTQTEYEDEDMDEPRPRKYMRKAYNYSEESDASDDVVEWNSKVKIPRMKMYADDVEKRKQKKYTEKPHRRPYGYRSAEKGSPEWKRFDLRQKLTRKRN